MAKQQVRDRTVTLEWPAGGINRRRAYSTQPPYTTPDALNVRPACTLEERLRGGSRPGLVHEWTGPLGSAGHREVRMISSLTAAPLSSLSRFHENFDGTEWETGWDGTLFPPNELPALDDGYAKCMIPGSPEGGLREVMNRDGTEGVTVRLRVTPSDGVAWDGWAHLYACMDGWNNRIQASVDMADLVAANNVVLACTVGGAVQWTHTTGFLFPVAEGELVLYVRENGYVYLYWNDPYVTGSTINWDTAGAAATLSILANNDVGFSGEPDAGREMWYEDFYAEWTAPITAAVGDMAILSAGGNLYRAQAAIVEVPTGAPLPTLSDDKMILAAEHLQKLFIADWSPPNAVGSGRASGTSLADADIANWTTLGISVDNDVAVLRDANVTAQVGSYRIFNVLAGALGLVRSARTGDVVYEVGKAPLVYDPATDVLAIWETEKYDDGTYKGHVPLACPLICRFLDSIILAGADWAPSNYFLCRAGNPFDWDFTLSSDDVGRAIAQALGEAGAVGPKITALIPHSDDMVIFGCADRMYAMRGDPRFGGRIDPVSHKIGVIDKLAWCSLPDGSTAFLSKGGLYAIGPGATGVPQEVSRDRMPEELVNLDVAASYITMQYDVAKRGIHIFLTPVVAGVTSAEHWWFDMATKGFWPVRFGDHDLEPTVSGVARTEGGDVDVLLGCRDGYIRRFSAAAASDEDYAFESYVVIGPLRAGPDARTEGLLQELRGTLDAQSGGVAWQVRTADSAEAALTAAVSSTGLWAAGANRPAYQLGRGGFLVLRIDATPMKPPGSAWAVEEIAARFAPGGPIRRL